MRLFVRTIWIAGATTKIGMANLVHILTKLIFQRVRVAASAKICAGPPGRSPAPGSLKPNLGISATTSRYWIQVWS